MEQLTPKELEKLLRKLETDSLDYSSIRPSHPYVYDFSDRLDDYLQQYDDALIALMQRNSGPYIYAVSVFFSSLTAIEAAIWMPFVLFSLGYDRAGTITTMFLLTLALISQIPKRFLWRPRPWMIGRARGVRKDPTSSFPSRGVACAIVYPIMILLGIEQEMGVQIPLWIYLASVLGIVISTFFARVYVGAHYPTDGFGGMLLGVFIVFLAVHSIRLFNTLQCPTSSKMYPEDVGMMLSKENWDALYPLLRKPLWMCALASLALAVVSGSAPVHFWLKNNYVYGLLLSCLSTRYVFLCPGMHGAGLAPLSTPDWMTHITRILLGGTFIGLSFLVKPIGKSSAAWTVPLQRLLKFLVMYVAVIFLIILFRVR